MSATTDTAPPLTLAELIDGGRMSRPQARGFMSAVIAGEVAPEVLAGSLTVLRHRGETTDEFLGFLDVLFAHAVKVPYDGKVLIDTCGTGGDGLGTFNVSTAAAVVAAACGLPVAKHGNRSVSSRSGSADVLEAAGVPIIGDVDRLAGALSELGLAFLFAPFHHPALKEVAPVRRALGVMTVFNLLGPQVNPAPLTHQLVGVPNLDFMRRYGAIFHSRALPAYVVHGRDGADEALPGGAFHLVRVDPKSGTEETIVDPADLGVAPFPLEAFRGGGPEENAEVLWALLEGNGPAALKEAIALNVGLALELTGLEPTAAAGVTTARKVMAAGEPAALLRRYIERVK